MTIHGHFPIIPFVEFQGKEMRVGGRGTRYKWVNHQKVIDVVSFNLLL